MPSAQFIDLLPEKCGLTFGPISYMLLLTVDRISFRNGCDLGAFILESLEDLPVHWYHPF